MRIFAISSIFALAVLHSVYAVAMDALPKDSLSSGGIELIRTSVDTAAIGQSNPKNFNWIQFHLKAASISEMKDETYKIIVALSKDDRPKDDGQAPSEHIMHIAPRIALVGGGVYKDIEKDLAVETESVLGLLQVGVSQTFVEKSTDMVSIRVTQTPNKSKKKICNEILAKYPWIIVQHNMLNRHWAVMLAIDIYIDNRYVGTSNYSELKWKTNAANKKVSTQIGSNESSMERSSNNDEYSKKRKRKTKTQETVKVKKRKKKR
jgi:hypothetical protein